MTFNDIFTEDFISRMGTEPTILKAALVLGVSLVLGIFIFYVYKKTYHGVMYSKTFNVSLVALAMISATVIMAVTSNVILSLGMVGALSIVRFRAAIKDPIDIIYMFWAISVGIISGAGLFTLATASSLAIGLMLFIFSKIKKRNDPYLLIVNYGKHEDEEEITDILKKFAPNNKIKSKIKTPGEYELTVEIRTGEENTDIVDKIDGIPGVRNVSMVSYDGDYAI